MEQRPSPAEQAERDIERAWRGQYRTREEAALARGMAGRYAEAGEPNATRARIIESFWRIEAEEPETDRPARFAAMARAAERSGDFRFAAIARYGQARAQEISPAHDAEQEIELVRSAIELAGRIGRVVEFDLAVFTNGLATWLRHCGRWIDALEHYYRAEAIALEGGEMGIAAMIQNNLGSLAFVGGDVRDAWASFETALESAIAAKADFLFPIIRRNLGETCYRLGLHGEALAWLEPTLHAEAEAAPRGSTTWSVAARAAIGSGDMAKARKLIDKAIAKAAESGNAKTRSLAILAAGRLALAEGRFADAKGDMLKAREEAVRSGERYYELDAIASLAELALAAGDRDAAREFFAEELSLRGELLGLAADSREAKRLARERIEDALAQPSRKRERDAMLPGLASLKVAEVETRKSVRRAKGGSIFSALAHQFASPLAGLMKRARELREARKAGATGGSQTAAGSAPDGASIASRELRSLERATSRLRRIATSGVVERARLADLVRRACAEAGRDGIAIEGDAEAECDQLALAYFVEELSRLSGGPGDARAGARRVVIEGLPGSGGARLGFLAEGRPLDRATIDEANKPIDEPYDFSSGVDVGWRVARTLAETALEGDFALAAAEDGSWSATLTLPGIASSGR